MKSRRKPVFFSTANLIIDVKYYYLLTIVPCVVGLAGGGRAEWVIYWEKGGTGLSWIAVHS